jgi:enamine deaminase RidA (YjgF/YER057c/UK114 family)
MTRVMIACARLQWPLDGQTADFFNLTGEGPAGLSPLEQLTTLVDAFVSALAAQQMTLETVVHQRVWLRDRALRDSVDGPRRTMLGGARRAASSSFFSASRFRAGSSVALELLAQRPIAGGERRLVDFTPPRRYAWYLMQDGWQHFSGMAEPGASLAEQFESACEEIERGLAAEGRDWKAVMQARLFLERGQGDESWLRHLFRKRAGLAADKVAFDWVDSLASPNKHLEIEAVARPQ